MVNISPALEHLDIPGNHKAIIVEILTAALDAANPQLVVEQGLDHINGHLRVGDTEYSLESGAKLVVIGLGKAAPTMVRGALKQLGNISGPVVCISKHGSVDLPGQESLINVLGNHPVPGVGSLRAGEIIRRAVSGLTAHDLVLLLLSGGGSSLATLPPEGISLADLSVLTDTLLRAGVTINEINTVRKHLDLLKGGGLLRLAAPAKVAALVLSDVVGNNLDVIASGPAYPDASTFKDALEIVSRAAKYGIIPAAVFRHLENGVSGCVPETVKPGDDLAVLGTSKIIASNVDSCNAAILKARELGIEAELLTDKLIGEARQAGKWLAGMAKSHTGAQKTCVLVSGGETTVTVTGCGLGGRNLEVALGAVRGMAGLSNTYLITLATDGEDGPTDAVGAFVSGGSLSKAQMLGLDPDQFLDDNDSYTFFKRTGDLIVTGPTGTNVNDISFVFCF